MEKQGFWVLVPGSLDKLLSNIQEVTEFFAAHGINFGQIESRIQPEGFAIFIEDPKVASLFKLTF